MALMADLLLDAKEVDVMMRMIIIAMTMNKT